MKVYLLLFAVLVCLFLCGCMHCVKSNIGEKILEDNREFDMALEYLATEFYEDEQFVYFKAPIQTFREIYPGAASVFLEGYFEDSNRYYSLSPVQKSLCFCAGIKNRWIAGSTGRLQKHYPKMLSPLQNRKAGFQNPQNIIICGVC